MKDKGYQTSPVGGVVGRYLRSAAYGGAKQNTLDSYEQVLAWLALYFDDLDDIRLLCEPTGRQALEEFLHTHWGSSAETTRRHRWTVLNVFFRWCVDADVIPSNPMRTIRKPRSGKITQTRRAYDQDIVARLVAAQEPLRDRCALGLLRLALRKNDLRMLQLRDLDLALDLVYLNHAKGGQRHQLPIEFPDLRADLGAHLAERTLEAGGDPGAEFLLYPKQQRRRPLDAASVHRWFKRCLDNAGLPGSMQMHELRHTAGDHMWRTTGNIVLAQKLLRHSSPATTAGYLHPTEDDLRAALRRISGLDEL